MLVLGIIGPPVLIYMTSFPLGGKRERTLTGAGLFLLFLVHIVGFFLGPVLIVRLAHLLASATLMPPIVLIGRSMMRDPQAFASERTLPLPAPVDEGA